MSKLPHYLFSSLLLPAFLASCGPKNTSKAPSSKATVVIPTDKQEDLTNLTGPGALDLLPTALAEDPMAVTIHQLKNGLRVYISTDRSTPSISSWIAVASGSRHDPRDSTGLAHYLEHMLFKGSSELGSLDIKKEQPHLDRIAKLYDELQASESLESRDAILAKIDRETQASSRFSIPNEFDNLYASLGIDGVNAFTGND